MDAIAATHAFANQHGPGIGELWVLTTAKTSFMTASLLRFSFNGIAFQNSLQEIIFDKK